MEGKVRDCLNDLSDFLKPDEMTKITDVSGTVVVTNLPRVDETKVDRLKTILLSKVFSKFGKIVENSLYMPQDNTNITTGYIISFYIMF